MPQLSVWIVGDWRQADFSAALTWLGNQARCSTFDNAAAALVERHSSASDEEPAAILLVQSRPGQIGEPEVERLHATAPLARLVALVGPWCEGPVRSGRPWPGVVHVPWNAWQNRLERELGIAGRDGASAAPLPRTATEAERVESSAPVVAVRRRSRRQAVVCTIRKTRYESLTDALDPSGFNALWHSAGSSSAPQADLLILDGWEQMAEDRYASFPPRLLLLDFPRPDDHLRAASLGIDSVMAVPFLHTDLAIVLQRLVDDRSQAPE